MCITSPSRRGARCSPIYLTSLHQQSQEHGTGLALIVTSKEKMTIPAKAANNEIGEDESAVVEKLCKPAGGSPRVTFLVMQLEVPLEQVVEVRRQGRPMERCSCPSKCPVP